MNNNEFLLSTLLNTFCVYRNSFRYLFLNHKAMCISRSYDIEPEYILELKNIL